MKKRRLRALVVGFSAAIVWPLLIHGQEKISLKDVIEKNLQASGGREKLAQIQNISFKAGNALYYASSSGELKLLAGKGSVPTEIVLVSGGKVQKSSSGQISDLTGIPGALNQTLGKLFGGAFSLLKFEGGLEFRGLKTYGPEKLYHLTTKIEPLEVGLFVRAEDFFLKRLVLQGKTPEGDKYEVNYDFAPFEEAEGLKLPLSWFSSQVGTRGTLFELSEIKINQPLDKDFFSKLDAMDPPPARSLTSAPNEKT